MTINPVDLQVTLPQTGQVNKIQRGLQQQQQTEQQILGQLIHREMKEKEQTVQKMKHVDHNKIQNEDLHKEKEKHHDKKQAGNFNNMDTPEQKKQEKSDTTGNEEHRGRLLDIKV